MLRSFVTNELSKCDNAVKMIKTAILQSQADAVRATNKRLLALYFGVGKYLSINSRTGTWGTGAINAISERLDRELPGLRGFSPRNLRNMRVFYEEWSFLDKLTLPATSNGKSNLADASAKLQDDASARKNPDDSDLPTPGADVVIWRATPNG